MSGLIPEDKIGNNIYLIRGQKVMLDSDLAELYGINTKILKRAVRRNRERFPGDFMFELNETELKNWRCQIGTSNSDKMGLRWKPFAFTEQGVAMLSSVLRSRKAILVNIAIMRAFVRLKQVLATHKEVSRKLKELEQKYEQHDGQIKAVFDAIRKLMAVPDNPKGRIGFITDGD